MIKFAPLASTLALAFAAAAFAASTTLATPINADDGSVGIIFDVAVGATPLSLQSIGVNVGNGVSTYEFWTRGDTVVGHTDSSPGWILRNTFSSVTSAGSGVLTRSDFTAAAGSIFGVYFTSTTGGNINYATGFGVAAGRRRVYVTA